MSNFFRGLISEILGLVLFFIVGLGFEVNDAWLLTLDTNLVLPLLVRHRAIIGHSCDLCSVYGVLNIVYSSLVSTTGKNPFIYYIPVNGYFHGSK